MAAGTEVAPEAVKLITTLSKLDVNDLVKLTLQRPQLPKVFASTLHAIAIARATRPIPSTFNTVQEDDATVAIVDILLRLIERGDPSLARKFLPTHGALIDLAIVAHNVDQARVKVILDRLLDSSAVEEILQGIQAQLQEVSSTETDLVAIFVSIRTLARLLSTFLSSCPARALQGLDQPLISCLKTCFEVYDITLQRHSQQRSAGLNPGHLDEGMLSADDWRLHCITAKVDLLQASAMLLTCLVRKASSIHVIMESALGRASSALQAGNFAPMVHSTILLDLAVTTNVWSLVQNSLRTVKLSPASSDTLHTVDALAAKTPKFTGTAWSALCNCMVQERKASMVGSNKPEAVSDDVVATVHSVLPHYGMETLKVILSRPSFRGLDAETIIQILLEGDEGEAAPSTVQPVLPAPPSIPTSMEPVSLVKARANLFGDFGFDLSSVLTSKSKTVEELAPELKAAILARAEAADEDEAEEEWNPFAESTTRTVGVEDELDLDYEGRERSIPVRSSSLDEADDAEEEEEDPVRARERNLIKHYIKYGSVSFSQEKSIRQSHGRKELKEQTGFSDDLIESWGIMFERNPNKDRLLAAASRAEFDDRSGVRNGRNQEDSNEDGWSERRFGPDKGRGGRILGGRGRGLGGPGGGGGGGGGGSASSASSAGRGGGSKNATRGRGTGNSATDRSAKQKEKQGNKARQRGHDKKMARANP